MDTKTLFKIGDVAKQTNVSVGTLRYYETLKLLKPIERGNNGYRHYTVDAVQKVKFIKKAQSLGFSLEEIRQIIEIRDYGELPCQLVQELLHKKIQELETQIHEMISFKNELEEYKKSWAMNDLNLNYRETQDICPLIASMP
ncbi:heavy metal-responsive transcriptional regulator [Geminocystis sp. NIES-3709]|uniref:heavy metal-responsive transcriptional regulator n=1 Tax=Geminocystis sp. NIES-3709 TaxID=1617448 RepID=UPI0005FC45F7|nr:heavy metal-responsive transcriptional regulator [Geminocystis sp. NIES-3709]BAQ64387.1 MerR family transcriptional regulator [Geminocystis sp. NIES-3709]